MKNKPLTYILLIAVAVIWYQVFLRIKSNVLQDENDAYSKIQQHSGFQLIKKDTFLLNANYRDPFIGKPKQGSQEVVLIDFEPIPKPVKPEFVWPKINYYGWVRKTDSKNPLCIVNIDGILLYLRKGEDIFDGIKVIAVDRDFIQLRKGKNQHYFYRE